MRTLIAFGLILIGPAVAFAQDAPEEKAPPKVQRDEAKHQEAVELLKKVDAAAKAVETCRYDSTWKPTGFLAERMGSASGRVLLGAKVESAGGAHKMKVTTKIQRTPSAEVAEYTTGFDGDEFYLIDPTSQKVHADIDPGVVGTDGQNARAIVMQEFAHPTPFSDEINSDSAEILRKEMFDGQECSVVHVVYAGGRGEAVWWFSNKDYLPRQREQLFKNPDGERGSWVLTITNLEIAPEWQDKAFALVVPEGYKKTDEFAPQRGMMN
ncbi:MAG: hypothetical protein J5J06_04170 [Phycisphaerae bacterium]|nr:hypothetical protein [Phycisphaerae bacterium]